MKFSKSLKFVFKFKFLIYFAIKNHPSENKCWMKMKKIENSWLCIQCIMFYKQQKVQMSKRKNYNSEKSYIW